MKSLFLLVFTALYVPIYAQTSTEGYSYDWTPYMNPRDEARYKEIGQPAPAVTSNEIYLVKKLFKQLDYSNDPFYTQPELQARVTNILNSDEIILYQESENIWDIQYGTYSQTSFGIPHVTVYHHVFLDVQTRKILPRWEISFTY